MGFVRISGDVLGTPAFDALVERVDTATADFRPLWAGMGRAFRANEAAIFDSEGPGWKPLSPAYAAWKDSHYPGRPILVRTGSLRTSLTVARSLGNVNEQTPTTATFGTTNDHAMYHQTGNLNTTHYPLGTHPPKRPPVVVTDRLKQQWRRRLADWVRDTVEEG